MSLLLTIMTNLSSPAKHIGIETIEFWKLYRHVIVLHSITPKVLALRRSTTAIPLIGPATSTKSLLSIEPVHFTQRNLDAATAESNGLTGDVKIARWWYKALTHSNAVHRSPLELLEHLFHLSGLMSSTAAGVHGLHGKWRNQWPAANEEKLPWHPKALGFQ